METQMEDLRKCDKARLKEILKQTNEEMDHVNEECNVLLEILLRKRYKNISETKPFMLRVGKKRYRDNDGNADHDEELAPPVPIGRRPADKAQASSSTGANSHAGANSVSKAAEERDSAVELTEAEADTMEEVDDSKEDAVEEEQEEEDNQEESAEIGEEGGEEGEVDTAAE